MPLIECPECHKEISDKASTCPQCGFPIRKAAIGQALSKTLSTASAGAKTVTDALALRKAKFKALTKCTVIFLLGALLFQFVVQFGAICMAIYSVALFKTIRVVWKKTAVPQSPAKTKDTPAPKPNPDDDTRFMPPDMRAESPRPVVVTRTEPLPLPSAPEAEPKQPAPESNISSFLPRAIILFILFAILSLILRPLIEDYLRKSCSSQKARARNSTQDFQLERNVFCATNTTSQSSSTNCVNAWQIVTNVDNVVFGYPSDMMEEQSSEDQVKGNSLRKNVFNLPVQSDTTTFRLQQKGLSSRKPESFKTFMRIAINQSAATPDAIIVFGGLSEATAEDIRVLDESTKEGLTRMFAEMSLNSGKTVKLLSVPASKIIRLSRVPVLKTTIRQQTDTRPIVIQTEYKVLRNNKMITITTQFREEERERWERTVDSVIGSVQFP